MFSVGYNRPTENRGDHRWQLGILSVDIEVFLCCGVDYFLNKMHLYFADKFLKRGHFICGSSITGVDNLNTKMETTKFLDVVIYEVPLTCSFPMSRICNQ